MDSIAGYTTHRNFMIAMIFFYNPNNSCKYTFVTKQDQAWINILN